MHMKITCPHCSKENDLQPVTCLHCQKSWQGHHFSSGGAFIGLLMLTAAGGGGYWYGNHGHNHEIAPFHASAASKRYDSGVEFALLTSCMNGLRARQEMCLCALKIFQNEVPQDSIKSINVRLKWQESMSQCHAISDPY